MAEKLNLTPILHACAKQSSSARLPFRYVREFVTQYANRRADEQPELSALTDDRAEGTLVESLTAMEKDGLLSLQYSGGSVISVFFPLYFLGLIRDKYKQIENRPSVPFPDDASLESVIPADLVRPVDVTSEYVEWIQKSDEVAPEILRLQFPDKIPSIIVVSESVATELLSMCMQKVRLYLRSTKNASYIHHKLLSHFPTREAALSDAIRQVLTTPHDAVSTIRRPTDFTYNLWTHMCTSMIKDIRSRNELLEHDSSSAQAAYLIGYYNAYYRGLDQKQREEEFALKVVEKHLEDSRVPFTFRDVITLPDDRGNPISRKLPTDRVAETIEKRIKPGSGDSLAPLLRIRGADQVDYYVPSAHAFAHFLQHREALSDELRRYYIERCSAAFKQDRVLMSMKNDELFQKHILQEVRTRSPYLAGLLKYEILFLLAQSTKGNADYREDLRIIFAPEKGRLQPLDVVFELDRNRIIKDAELLLPFYLGTPFLRAITRYVRALFSGRVRPSDRVEHDVADERDSRSSTTSSGRTSTSSTIGDDEGIDTDEAPPMSAVDTGMKSDTSRGTGVSSGPTRPKSAGSKAPNAAYRQQVKDVVQEFIPDPSSIDKVLGDLHEKWNPLIAEPAKSNLREDINSLVRDFLRKMRSGFRSAPPGADRIRKMAQELSDKDSFAQIRRKESLRRYIELYMLKLLGRL
ncbi:MAG: hypothetical protein EA383_13650 [Spirochaetaceae bacterium]|nr:MAG: hypothetical protein EA383_13650 [Spirochaetaceae bacterium]